MKKINPDRIAERFLSTGKFDKITPEELATVCDRIVRTETQVSVPTSIDLGRRFVTRAEPYGGPLLMTALRALGWAYLVGGEYSRAEKTYLKARSLLRRDALSRGRIDRVLIDVYMYLGRLGEAKRRARMALGTFRRLKADDDIAKTNVNYANLLHRQDRHKEARVLYQRAGDHFLSRKDDLAAALCFYNLANTLVQLFDFKKAAELYEKARKIFKRHGHLLHATGCLYGLSWLHMLQGDFHMALQELSVCENGYRQGKQPRELILCQLDRAESYLSLNLFVDARKAAEDASRKAGELGIMYEKAKAEFFCSKATLGLGQIRAARAGLRRAEEGFSKEKSKGFLAAVRFFQAQLESSNGLNRARLASSRRLLRKAQLPLWEAICDLQILAAQPNDHSTARRLARNKAVKTVPHLLASHHTLMGDREAGRSRTSSAVRHWTRAANILDSVRAKLPPVEMRSAFFGQQSDPYRKLIRAESDRNPLKAAVWSEKFKTAGLWATSDEVLATNPARQQIEKSLSELATQVTAVSALVDDKSGHRSMTGRVGEAFDKLGRRIRNELASLEQLEDSRPEAFEDVSSQIVSCSMKQPIVQFHVGARDIFAFVHYRGSSRAHCYPDGTAVLGGLVARWRFLVECAPASIRKPRSRDLSDEKEILRRISTWLLPPLELPGDNHRLLILPEGQLASLPWAGLHHNGGCLTDSFELVFAPSLRHHLHAERISVRSRKVRIFVGESHGLPHIREELAAVRSRAPKHLTEFYDPCRRSDWPDNSSAGLWHFTGHASLRSDNPFYSALMLADGPLFAADFRLKRNRVKLVTLAACRTGQHTSLPGEESTGLVRSLLEMGAQNVIASNWAVSDLSTSLWMDLMYKSYLSGSTAGEAVRHAAEGVRETFPSVYNWGAFSTFGAG
ncbi:MAG: CHAT domain-containing protein [Candidatus Zixiibacteriota bacterium]|nr:MAG: CHAT domain-containing protein [candidate division Zixibacteria bacterium]